MTRLGCVVACLSVATPFAYADSPEGISDEARQQAAVQYDRAVALLEEGDLQRALAELDRLYGETRHPQVLYNLAVLYGRLNRPVEALRAFDALLTQPGELAIGVPPDVVRSLRAAQARKVAYLTVTTSVPATIVVDGVDVGETPQEAPVVVAAGRMTVTLLAPDYQPSYRTITLAGEEQRRLDVSLVPSTQRTAKLKVRTMVPGVEVWLDGERIGRTPLAGPVAVEPGTHRVTLRRAGYRPVARELVIEPGGTAELNLPLDEDPHAGGGGRLQVALSEPDANVFIDGKLRRAPDQTFHLPAGPHLLRVVRQGFLPSHQVVDVPAEEGVLVEVALAPTGETRADYERGVQAQQLAGWISLAGGATLFVGSGIGWLFNEGALDRTIGRQAAAISQFTGGPPCGVGSDMTTNAYAACLSMLRSADEAVSHHQDLQLISLLGVGLGAVALSAGAILLLTSGDSSRYAGHAERKRKVGSEAWALTGEVGPAGGGLRWSWTF